MATQTRKTQTPRKPAPKSVGGPDIQISSNKPKAGTADPVTVDLYGETYEFIPVKTGVVMSGMLQGTESAMAKALGSWLTHSVSEEDKERILERLSDPSDDLDTEDLMETMQSVMEYAAGRPTS